jgi:hypothetical protein
MARHMTAHKSADDRKVHQDELKRMRRKNHCAPIGLICRTFLPVSARCATILLNTGPGPHSSNSIRARGQR